VLFCSVRGEGKFGTRWCQFRASCESDTRMLKSAEDSATVNERESLHQGNVCKEGCYGNLEG